MIKLSIAVAAAMLSAVGSAGAQSYPSRPITMLVGYAVGGPSDTIARIMADRMKVALGQPVIIENVTGAAGSLAVGRGARAAPDGYTLVMGDWSTHVVNAAMYDLQYDVVRDFEPVSLLPSAPQIIVTPNSVPATNLKELIAWIKANAEQGQLRHLRPRQPVACQRRAAAKRHRCEIPAGALSRRGAGDAGHGREHDPDFDVSGDGRAAAGARGHARAYAITAPKRSAAAPDIPTVDEAGLPGFHISLWWGFWMPKGTPKDIIARLNAAVVETLADPATQKRIADQGLDSPARDQQTPEALAAYQKAEIEKWWPIVKAANIKAQ